jgi:hypothetical protein
MLPKLTGYSGMVVITSAGCDNLASNSVRRTPVALACDVLHWPVFGSKCSLAHRGALGAWVKMEYTGLSRDHSDFIRPPVFGKPTKLGPNFCVPRRIAATVLKKKTTTISFLVGSPLERYSREQEERGVEEIRYSSHLHFWDLILHLCRIPISFLTPPKASPTIDCPSCRRRKSRKSVVARSHLPRNSWRTGHLA